ncbi:DUF624 domain-containing protein [Microbacterium sp. NPDC056052]|uniref:DUF624 domain-containing protein n=1 Tax=Microbacterium sp. NPDC056052 TaxID=3345695 RepID=UPI0035DBA65A
MTTVRVTHARWSALIAAAYTTMGLNLMLALAMSPLLAMLILTDPVSTWPVLAILAPFCAPAVTAVFSVFQMQRDGESAVVRPFLRAWRRAWRRATMLGALSTTVTVVLLTDLAMLSMTTYAPLVVPVLWTLLAVSAAMSLTAAVAVVNSRRPEVPIRRILMPSLILSVRRWPASILSLIVIVVQLVTFANAPALAIGITAAPVLYLIWTHAQERA